MTKRKKPEIVAEKKTTTVMGRVISLSDGREVGLYMLGPDSFGWRFVNKKGDCTQIVLSREAMNAVLALHNETTWDEWKVTPEPQDAAP